MPTAEILSLISKISYLMSVGCLGLTLFFWFYFRIPTVLSALSAKTAEAGREKERSVPQQAAADPRQPKRLTMIQDVMLIHTDEVLDT